jgi:hypothetical protein
MRFGTNPVTMLGYLKILKDSQVATSTTAAALADITQPTAGQNPTAANSEPFQIEMVVIQNDDAGINVLIGDSNGQHYKLTPGSSIALPIRDVTSIYVKSASGTPNINVLYLGQ